MSKDRITVGELHTALVRDPRYNSVGLQTELCLRDLPRNDWTQRVASLYAHKPAADDPQAKLIAWWWALGLPLYGADGSPVQGREALKKKGPLDWHILEGLQVSLAELRETLAGLECPLPAQLYPEDPLNTEALERAAMNDEDRERFFMEALAEELPTLRRRLQSWEAMQPQSPEAAETQARTIQDLEERIAHLEPYERVSPLAELQQRFREIEEQEEGDPAKSREQVRALIEALRRHCPSEEQRDLEGRLPGTWKVLRDLGRKVDAESPLARTPEDTLRERFKAQSELDWWAGFDQGNQSPKLLTLFREYIEKG